MERQTIKIQKPVDKVKNDLIQIINAFSGKIEEQDVSFLFWSIIKGNHQFQGKTQFNPNANFTELTTYIFSESNKKYQNNLISTIHNYLLQEELDYTQISVYEPSEVGNEQISPSDTSKNKIGKKKKLYYTLLIISVLLFLFLFIHIGTCEEEAYGDIGSRKNIIFLLAFSVLFLLIQIVVFSIDGFILLIKKLNKSEVNNSELYCLGVGFILFLLWIQIGSIYSNNGTCDAIIGPADTGLVLAMLIAIIINSWKVSVIKNTIKIDI